MREPNELICGMSPPTAQRYLMIREEIDILIQRIYKIGHRLSQLDRPQSDSLGRGLSLIGLTIMNSASVIHDCLENEFVSLQELRDGLNANRP